MLARFHVWLAWAGICGSAAALNVVGCGGGSSGSGGGGGATPDPCFDYAKFDGSKPATTFKKDVLPIFRRSCGLSSSCHGSDPPPADNQPFLGPADGDKDPTQKDIDNILGHIVGKPAAIPKGVGVAPEPDGLNIVEAGHPEKSFMMDKVDALINEDLTVTFCSKLKCAGPKTCGDSMPQGGPELDADDRDTLRRWIAQGAKNN